MTGPISDVSSSGGKALILGIDGVSEFEAVDYTSPFGSKAEQPGLSAGLSGTPLWRRDRLLRRLVGTLSSVGRARR